MYKALLLCLVFLFVPGSHAQTASPEQVRPAADRAVAIGGVMGGLDTEVTAETKNILIESASFRPSSVHYTAAKLGLHSEASQRFERGIARVEGVRTCYHITGRFDYLVHVAVRDLDHLGALIKTDIAAIPGVDKLETLQVLTEVKADAGWPAVHLDD